MKPTKSALLSLFLFALMIGSAEAQYIQLASALNLGGSDGCTGCADPGCTDRGGCASCNNCGCGSCRQLTWWAGGEYMMMWSKKRNGPALATTSPNGTAQNDAGVLPGASSLLGGDEIGQSLRSGGRFRVGAWIDRVEGLGIGGSMMGMGDSGERFSGASNGDPILAVPFFNLLSGLNDSLLVAYPGVATGTLDAEYRNRIYAADAFVRVRAYQAPGFTFDLIGGYAFNRMNDSAGINANVNNLVGGIFPANSNFDIRDQLAAKNEFHGGTFGFIARIKRDRITLRTTAKFGIGNMTQTMDINGQTIVTLNNGTQNVSAGGLFALPSNIGTYSQDDLVFIPDVHMSIGYRVNNCLELTLGYNFMWWSRVVMVGDHIDDTINISQMGGNTLVGPPRPAFNGLRDTDFWMMGITFGANWQF